jgi:hypothetical protein
MGRIYEVRHDTYTKFHKDWLSHPEVDRGDTQTNRQHGDHISLVLFFQNMESRLKNNRRLMISP